MDEKTIIELCSSIEHASVTHILIKVYILLSENENATRKDFLLHLCFHGIGICCEGMMNTFAWLSARF